jgi:hypothetical protein
MWTVEHTAESDAAPEAVYALYADVAGWPAWDPGLERCELDGPFATGTTGHLTPAGGEPLPFTVEWAEPARGFADVTEAMGHVLRFRHTLQPLPGGGTRITHRVEIEGPAADELGPNVVGEMPEAMAALAALATRVPAG